MNLEKLLQKCKHSRIECSECLKNVFSFSLECQYCVEDIFQVSLNCLFSGITGSIVGCIQDIIDSDNPCFDCISIVVAEMKTRRYI